MSEVDEVAEDSANQKNVEAKIKAEIAKAEIVLFMKGSPATPQCGFSAMATHILQLCKVGYHSVDVNSVDVNSVDVLAGTNFKESLKSYSDWPTIPQLYIKGEFIGGCDIMREMFDNGELQDLLASKGIAQKTS